MKARTHLRNLEIELMEFRDLEIPIHEADVDYLLSILRDAMDELGIKHNGRKP